MTIQRTSYHAAAVVETTMCISIPNHRFGKTTNDHNFAETMDNRRLDLAIHTKGYEIKPAQTALGRHQHTEKLFLEKCDNLLLIKTSYVICYAVLAPSNCLPIYIHRFICSIISCLATKANSLHSIKPRPSAVFVVFDKISCHQHPRPS